MLPILQAVAPLAKILFNTIDKSVPDKDLAAKLKNDHGLSNLTIKDYAGRLEQCIS